MLADDVAADAAGEEVGLASAAALPRRRPWEDAGRQEEGSPQLSRVGTSRFLLLPDDDEEEVAVPSPAAGMPPSAAAAGCRVFQMCFRRSVISLGITQGVGDVEGACEGQGRVCEAGIVPLNGASLQVPTVSPPTSKRLVTEFL